MTAKKNSDDRLTITVNPSCMSEDDSERFGSLLKDGRCGFAHDEEKAAIFYEASASCADGNLEAVTDRGELYLSGKSMEEDIDKAFMYFNEAALEGQARGMTGVGLTYEERGDDHMAAEWYRAAALLGDDAALYNYADMLHKGRGSKKTKRPPVKYSGFLRTRAVMKQEYISIWGFMPITDTAAAKRITKKPCGCIRSVTGTAIPTAPIPWEYFTDTEEA